jgi:hypothetical protein
LSKEKAKPLAKKGKYTAPVPVKIISPAIQKPTKAKKKSPSVSKKSLVAKPVEGVILGKRTKTPKKFDDHMYVVNEADFRPQKVATIDK